MSIPLWAIKFGNKAFSFSSKVGSTVKKGSNKLFTSSKTGVNWGQSVLCCFDNGQIMPQVGKKKFAYTKAGKKKAKSYAKKKGKKVKYS